MFEVKRIEKEMTYSLRYNILRPYQKVEDCVSATDYDDDTFHVGAFCQGELVSVASFCIEKHPDFSNEKQYRLRAMATHENYRKLGAGKSVVNFAENLIKEKGFSFLWCKGRTTAQEYYSKLGFKAYGEVFDYPPIGLHIIMYKELGYNKENC
jgi:ribosomal protein S18 acetylase RimI-like enzyme